MSEEPKHPVETSRKTIRILDALHELERAGVTELSRKLGMNKSTIHNHLSTLKSEELIVQTDGEYALGLKLLEYGGRTRNKHPLYKLGVPEIERLAAQTGEFANLVVEEYDEGVYLDCKLGENAVDLNIYPGLRRPLHLTASGKAILAHLPQERVDGIIERRGLHGRTEQSITDREELLENLAEVRERGFAVDNEEHISGLRCIGAPVLDSDGEVLGSVSLSVPTTRMDDDRFLNEVPDMVSSATNVIELHIQHS